MYVLCTDRIGLRSSGNRRDLGEEEGRERERGRKEGEGGQYITPHWKSMILLLGESWVSFFEILS